LNGEFSKTNRTAPQGWRDEDVPIVVDYEEFKQLTMRMSTGLEASMMNQFGFERAEEAFHRYINPVVSYSSTSIYATLLSFVGGMSAKP
jgi:hypothetical protein